MSLIHNDELPQETAQELPILHAHLIGSDDDWEGRCGVRSRLDIAASALATAFPQIADTSRVGRL